MSDPFSEQARADFQRARFKAFMNRVWATLSGKPTTLLSYDTVKEKLHIGGPIYLAASASIGLWFLWEAIATYRESDETKEPAAHRLFGVSLLYLAALFAALIVEKLAGIPALSLTVGS